MVKKLYGLSVNQEIDENGVVFPSLSSSFLICVSSNEDLLLQHCDVLQKAADLLAELLPSRGYHSKYRVEEINYLDL